MRLLAAPDKFRGSATAADAADAMARACDLVGWRCTRLPMADGGEGTLEVFGGANRESIVTGPLGNPVRAGWRRQSDTAIVEMARAAGLQLAGGTSGNDPMRATSRGVGELVELAHRAGAGRVIVGVGGSACTDGGAGAVEVLGKYAPLDGSRGLTVVVASDVRTLFLDAAAIYGPQKGATADQVAELTERLERVAEGYRRDYGVDVRTIPGGGAAGGLAGGLAALGARIESGFDLIAQELGLQDAIAHADLVLTGEGRLDGSSMDGKVVGGVLRMAHSAGVRGAVIAGQVAEDVSLDETVVSLTVEFGLDRSMFATMSCIAAAAATILSGSTPEDL